MSDSYFDVAQVCLNGHAINSCSQSAPGRNEDFCSDCGAKTISACEACGEAIRGYYHIPGVFRVGTSCEPPKFCHRCGDAYPWTKTALQAALDLAQEIDGLSPEERSQLAEAIPNLLTDSPKTPAAESRFKRIMGKVGKEAANTMRSVMVDVVSETIKKSLFGE
jgi:hypothetical protein